MKEFLRSLLVTIPLLLGLIAAVLTRRPRERRIAPVSPEDRKAIEDRADARRTQAEAVKEAEVARSRDPVDVANEIIKERLQ